MDAAQTELLRARLCRWFEREQRELPWRRTRDAYAIWISEAMLQQTRVETVIPYWARFLERFPDLRALARAGEAEVVAAWSGLGYYRRARALHAAARAIAAEHAGELPRTRAHWLALPGVGPYTAGAVLSIAFDEPEPLVDGNVLRVFARWFESELPLDQPAGVRAAWLRAAELMPPRPRSSASSVRPRNWNQALMELGATVCVPREPRCPVCPVADLCRARLAGRERELPRASARVRSVAVELESLVIARAGRILLQQRSGEARMAGLWELPTRELAAEPQHARLWPTEFAAELVRLRASARELASQRHAITTHRIRVALHAASAHAGLRPSAAELRWFAPAEFGSAALTGMAHKALRHPAVRALLAAPAAEPRPSERAPRVAARPRRGSVEKPARAR